MDHNHVTIFVYMNDIETVFGDFGRKCIMSEDGTTNYHIVLKQATSYIYCWRLKRVTEFA